MTACPVCQGAAKKWIAGTTTGAEFFDSGDTYLIAKGEGEDYLPVWKCLNCGHGFTPIDFESDLIAEWYARAQPDEHFLAGENARRLTARRVLKRLEEILPDRGRILDVGAGPGLFLDEARKRGWKTAGLEPAAWASAYARDTLGLPRVRTGDTAALAEFPAGSFDVVTAFDVIEHVADPLKFARSLARVVKPGGCLVLTTPRLDSPLARFMGKRWYCIFPAHLHYFTRPSLTKTLRGAGFEIVDERSHVRYLGWKYWIQRALVHLGLSSGEKPAAASVSIPINYGDEFEIYAQKR